MMANAACRSGVALLTRTRRRIVSFAGGVIAAIALLASPFACAHGDGTTGGELKADKDGSSVSLTLSVRGLSSAGIVRPEMYELPDFFDAQNKPLLQLVENTRQLLIFRVGETVIAPIIEPGAPDPEATQRMVRFNWELPSGSRSFSIERSKPDSVDGIADWLFTQVKEDGTPGDPRYVQVMYGDRATFALTGAEDSAAEEVVETRKLGIGKLLWLGFRHIVPEGVDHMLVRLALCLPLPRWGPSAGQATAFTLAHSVTLGLAMAGLVLVPSRAVEAVIALSIVVVALGNLRTRKVSASRWIMVFIFGLVHGLGFAGSFAQLKASPGDLGRTLLFLNLGIELAQLTVLVSLTALGYFIRKKEWYRPRVVVPASLVVAAYSAWLVAQRIVG